MEFAALMIEVESGNVKLTQPLMCEDDQIITFPIHQAKAVCDAILEAAKEQ